MNKEKRVSVALNDISAVYPKSSLDSQYFRVNTRNMNLVGPECSTPTPAKTKQTARKSTNSKLKRHFNGLKSKGPVQGTATNKPIVLKIKNSNLAPNSKHSYSSEVQSTKSPIKTIFQKLSHSNGEVVSITLPKSVSVFKNGIKLPNGQSATKVKPTKSNGTKVDKTTVSNSKSLKNPVEKSLSNGKTNDKPLTITQNSIPDPLSQSKIGHLIESEISKNKTATDTSKDKSSNLKSKETKNTTPQPSNGIDSSSLIVKKEKIDEAFNSANANSNKNNSTPVDNSQNKSATAPKKPKFSLESVVQNLNKKQLPGSKEVESSKRQHLKRSGSVSSDETNVKKPKLSDEKLKNDNKTLTTMSNAVEKSTKQIASQTNLPCSCKLENFQIILEKYVQKFVAEELARNEAGKKNIEFLLVKDKCEGIEKNFGSWIKFANSLQTRMKKVANAVLRQRGSLKLKSHLVNEKKDADTQTDVIATDADTVKKPTTHSPNTAPLASKTIPLVSPNLPNAMKNDEKAETKLPLATADAKQSIPKVVRRSLQGNKVVSVAAVIDLTDDNGTEESTLTLNKTPPKVINGFRKIQPKIQEKNISFQDIVSGAHRNLYGDRSNVHLQNANQASTVFSKNTKNILPKPPQTQQQSSLNLPSFSSAMQSKQQSIVPRVEYNSKRESMIYPPLPNPPQKSNIVVPPNALGPPPKLLIAIRQNEGGIVLSWKNNLPVSPHAAIHSYELYAHQDPMHPSKTWKEISNESIKALPLPMACTLTQFSTGATYFFTVRGKDVFGRYGPFSTPCSTKCPT